MIRITLSLIFMLLLGMLLGRTSRAHDPYMNLYVPGTSDVDMQNGSGRSCCGGGEYGDCFETETRVLNGQLQAFVPPERNILWQSQKPVGHGDWVDVPSSAILPAEKNPITGPSICYTPGGGVRCFLPGRAF